MLSEKNKKECLDKALKQYWHKVTKRIGVFYFPLHKIIAGRNLSMWEFVIMLDKSKEQYIQLFEKSIKQKFKGKKYICSYILQDSVVKLLIACENQDKNKMTSTLDEVIAELFVTKYKEDYFKINLKLKDINPTNFYAFIKALICFDKEYDKKYIKERLHYNTHLYLDSFFAFSLKQLQRKWQDICDLTNENATFLKSEDTFLELLKFLIKSLKCKNKSITIVHKNDTYNFLNASGKKLRGLKDLQNEKALISTLIELNPQTINISTDGTIKINTLNLLNTLFEGKINLVTP